MRNETRTPTLQTGSAFSDPPLHRTREVRSAGRGAHAAALARRDPGRLRDGARHGSPLPSGASPKSRARSAARSVEGPVCPFVNPHSRDARGLASSRGPHPAPLELSSAEGESGTGSPVARARHRAPHSESLDLLEREPVSGRHAWRRHVGPIKSPSAGSLCIPRCIPAAPHDAVTSAQSSLQPRPPSSLRCCRRTRRRHFSPIPPSPHAPIIPTLPT